MLKVGDEVVYEKVALNRWEKDPYPYLIGHKGTVVSNASYTVHKVDFGELGYYICAKRYLFTSARYLEMTLDSTLIKGNHYGKLS